MRILFLTAYYPPCDYGWGYMQLCEEVADGLAGRGHKIAVLTSNYRHGSKPDHPYPVYRQLTLDPDWHSSRPAAWQFFAGRRRREAAAIAALRRVAADFRPDIIFVWHAIGLPRLLLQAAEQMPEVAVCYYLAGYLPELPDEYIAYWQSRPARPVAGLLKRPLAWLALRMLAAEGKPASLRYTNTIAVSHYVRRRLVDQRLIPQSAVVIHNGIDLSHFRPRHPRDRNPNEPLSLLYAGRLEPSKGVHHLIEALALLSDEERQRISRLTIAGVGKETYMAGLREMAAWLRLQSLVRFIPPLPRDQMPAFLETFDTLLLPSSLEALSRSMQEAMAMGLLVIGTDTGGSAELLVHDQTGLVFSPDDPASLAAQLRRALAQPELVRRLAQAGQEEVASRFDIRLTIDKIEQRLAALLMPEQKP